MLNARTLAQVPTGGSPAASGAARAAAAVSIPGEAGADPAREALRPVEAIQAATSSVLSASLGLSFAALVMASALVAWLLVRRKRLRTTAHYAALLAGSEPIAPPEPVVPFAPKGGRPSMAPGSSATRTPSPVGSATRTPFPASSAGATPFPRTSSEEQSSPRSSPPPSGIAAPPVSERQWLSQPPPRSYKEPPS